MFRCQQAVARMLEGICSERPAAMADVFATRDRRQSLT